MFPDDDRQQQRSKMITISEMTLWIMSFNKKFLGKGRFDWSCCLQQTKIQEKLIKHLVP